MSNCPKCNGRIKPTYLKQNCPHCGVNMLYYKLDEQLEQDKMKAQKEVDAVNRFVNILKESTIKTPWHILRLILFFTPLASMCLPMFWAGHKNVSLITFVISIINHGLDFGALMADRAYLFAVLSIVFVILLSIVEIICSLFSATKNGVVRNIVVFIINAAAFSVFGTLAAHSGAVIKLGFIITLVIYSSKIVLHAVTGNLKISKQIIVFIIFIALCAMPFGLQQSNSSAKFVNDDGSGEVKVVSFNVASAFGTALEDTDSAVRCQRFADYMKVQSPDFIGTQEMNSIWMDELNNSLGEYKSYGIKRGGDSEEKNSEMNTVFWRADKYSDIETGTFWLSETPDVESKYTYVDAQGKDAEAGCNRVCSYAVLVNNENKKQYIFMNTHLDNASEQARVFGASVIIEKINYFHSEYGEDANIILTGDFNECRGDAAYNLLESELGEGISIDGATYQEWGYRLTDDRPIDFIFTTGNETGCFALDNIDSGYVSDHYGIASYIDF